MNKTWMRKKNTEFLSRNNYILWHFLCKIKQKNKKRQLKNYE